MTPQEIYWELEDSGFKPFNRGDIILTKSHGSFFSNLIGIKGLFEDEVPHVSHAEMYLTSGLSIGADKHGVTIKPIRKFFNGKYDVHVYTNISLTREQRDLLLKTAFLWHGKLYDVMGIVWQTLDMMFFTDWFSRKFNNVKLPYCSELVGRIYDALKINISHKPIAASTPNNILTYVSYEDYWNCVFKMEKVFDGWRVKQ